MREDRNTMAALEEATIEGDLSKLSTKDRLSYFAAVCESLRLNPLTRPFEFIKINGRMVLYAKKDATDQLRKIHKISLSIVSRDKNGDVYIVRARATTPDGRTDEDEGAVSIAGLKGETMANALMKATTKAKRRVTLSICGLGCLDETEIESIQGAAMVETPMAAVAQITATAQPVRPARPARPAQPPCLDMTDELEAARHSKLRQHAKRMLKSDERLLDWYSPTGTELTDEILDCAIQDLRRFQMTSLTPPEQFIDLLYAELAGKDDENDYK